MSVIGGRGHVYVPTKPTQSHSTVVLYEIENMRNVLHDQLVLSIAKRDWSPPCSLQRPHDYAKDKADASIAVCLIMKKIAALDKKRNKVVANQKFVDSVEGVLHRIKHLFTF